MSDERKRLRRLYGKECPVCKWERPKTNPSILLPGQRCKVDGHRDPRKREYHNEYLHPVPQEPKVELELEWINTDGHGLACAPWLRIKTDGYEVTQQVIDTIQQIYNKGSVK